MLILSFSTVYFFFLVFSCLKSHILLLVLAYFLSTFFLSSSQVMLCFNNFFICLNFIYGPAKPLSLLVPGTFNNFNLNNELF
jgi:hypothetical protein